MVNKRNFSCAESVSEQFFSETDCIGFYLQNRNIFEKLKFGKIKEVFEKYIKKLLLKTTNKVYMV